jgi:hypothetical protein
MPGAGLWEDLTAGNEREKRDDMSTAVLQRQTSTRNEHCHSCTSQCPIPCPAVNTTDRRLDPRMTRTGG